MISLFHNIDLYRVGFLVTSDVSDFVRDFELERHGPSYLEKIRTVPMATEWHDDKRWAGILLNVDRMSQRRDRLDGGAGFMAMLTHETAHATAYILHSIGHAPIETPRATDTEPWCYLQMHLMKIMLDHLGYE